MIEIIAMLIEEHKNNFYIIIVISFDYLFFIFSNNVDFTKHIFQFFSTNINNILYAIKIIKLCYFIFFVILNFDELIVLIFKIVFQIFMINIIENFMKLTNIIQNHY